MYEVSQAILCSQRSCLTGHQWQREMHATYAFDTEVFLSLCGSEIDRREGGGSRRRRDTFQARVRNWVVQKPFTFHFYSGISICVTARVIGLTNTICIGMERSTKRCRPCPNPSFSTSRFEPVLLHLLTPKREQRSKTRHSGSHPPVHIPSLSKERREEKGRR